jgi:TolB-like protein
MKKTIFKIIPIILLIMGCAGGAKSVENPANPANNSSSMTLDQALKEAASRIDERIVAGSKIAPLNFNSPHDKFSSYVLDELTANIVDSGKLAVVDRKEVDLIRSEFDFQFSGEVGDDSMQELGRMLGAQSIISGSLTDLGGFHRIVIRVLNVQNASVEVQYRANIVSDNIVTALLTGGKSNGTGGTPPGTSRTSVTQTSVTPAVPVVQDPIPVPQTPRQISEHDLVGVWKGSYGQGDGETALILSVFEEGSSYIAIFDFYNLPGKSNAKEGKYYMSVSYNRAREKFYLKGTEWIEQPSGYVMVDLEGTITRDVFSGFLSNYGNGYRFRVVKQETN